MKLRNPLGEALELLEQAERLQRRFFQLGAHPATCPSWEPPCDIFESEGQLAIFVALPGVSAEHLRISLDESGVTVSGQRPLPASASALIRRLEIPYGRFERRIELPAHVFTLGQHALRDGCLWLLLDKAGG